MRLDGTGGAMTARMCQRLVEASASSAFEAVEARVRCGLLGTIGSAMAASGSEGVRLVIENAVEEGGRGEASVPGRPERVAPLAAALATGMAAFLGSSQREDAGNGGALAAPILGATLGLGAVRGASGRDLLSAFAFGCETTLRLRAGLSPALEDAGWDGATIYGGIGATVAAGLLLHLGPEALAQAIGVAASAAAGNLEGRGTDLQAFQVGKAASNGVFAALLAERRFTASPSALEGPRGLFRALLPGQTVSLEVEDIGMRWELDASFSPLDLGEVEFRMRDLIEPGFPGRAARLTAAVAGLPDAADLSDLEAAIRPSTLEAGR